LLLLVTDFNSVHSLSRSFHSVLFFFNPTTTIHIYTLSLHDALPISEYRRRGRDGGRGGRAPVPRPGGTPEHRADLQLRAARCSRSEEHTSELQSRGHLVCRLLLEKKKNQTQLPCKQYYNL